MKKKYKTAIPLMMILSFIIFGCIATTSRVAHIKPTESEETEWALFAKANSGAFSDQIFIYINDEQVAQGTLSIMNPRTNIIGTYRDKKIDAECMATEDGGMMTGHKCTIYINSKKVSELSF